MLAMAQALGPNRKGGPNGGGGGGSPDAGHLLALMMPTGSFFQDTNRTTLATIVGQNVKSASDTAGAGKHFQWASGGIPTLAAGGGITIPAGGAELISPAAVAGIFWTLYARGSDANGGDSGILVGDGNTGANTVIQPRISGQVYYGVGAAYANPIADAGGESVYGMSVAGPSVVGFKDATEASMTLASAGFGSFRLGYGGATFQFEGTIRAAALYTGAHNASTRAAVRAYLNSLLSHNAIPTRKRP